MATSEVVLHIGAFKTGTSFIQSALTLNRAALADDGILVPGATWADQVRGVRDLAARSEPDAPIETRSIDRWDRIVEECRQWPGRLSVISMEFLSSYRPAVVEAAVRAFDPADVRVVFTARDLTYAIPAQWQESLQSSRRTWTLHEYADDIMAPAGQFTEATRHFWRKHNWQKVLHRWGAFVPADQMTVVVFPRPGSDPADLWHRFGVAAGFDTAGYRVPAMNNESLGAESLEVARRVNIEAASRGPVLPSARFRGVLCKRVMAARKPIERSVVLPEELTEWVAGRADQLIARLERLGPHVVGNFDDLRPQPRVTRATTTSWTEDLPEDDLVPAAESAAAGLAEILGTRWDAATADPGPRLRHAISSLVDLTS